MAKERYARIYRNVWRDIDFRALSMCSQWLYFALVTAPDLSTCGALPISERRWSKLCTTTSATELTDALGELDGARFVITDDISDELLIRTYMRHDDLWKSPNGQKSIRMSIEQIISTDLRDLARAALGELVGGNASDQGKQAPTEGACVGAQQAPTEGDTSPQQPAASSQQPGTTQHITNARAANFVDDPTGELDEMRAAALNSYAIHRAPSFDGGVRAARYSIRKPDSDESRTITRLLNDNPDATHIELCEALGMTETDLYRINNEGAA